MRNHAFSLLESVIVLVIVAVLLVMAIPSFQVLIQDKKAESVSSHLQKRIAFARSQAIKEGHPVVLCASSHGETCAGPWQAGQIVFVDTNQNGLRDQEERLLRVFSNVDGELAWNGFSSSILIFSPRGLLFNQNGHFKYCQAGKGFKLIVNQAGRVREERIVC